MQEVVELDFTCFLLILVVLWMLRCVFECAHVWFFRLVH